MLVRKACDAVKSSGVETLLQFSAEDCIWYPFPEWPDGAHPRTGHDGVRELLDSLTDNFDKCSVTIHDLREAGDRIVVLGKQAATIKGSGTPIVQPLGQVCSDLRDGKTGKCHFFLTWQEALEAAGLSE